MTAATNSRRRRKGDGSAAGWDAWCAANATDDRLLTRREAADVLGFQPQTLARWKWEGRADRPPEVRVGRSVRYRASALHRWIAERGESATRTTGTRTRNG
jgi:predicted DNA-binding transcriptional regulator AlpA